MGARRRNGDSNGEEVDDGVVVGEDDGRWTINDGRMGEGQIDGEEDGDNNGV